MKPVNSWIAFVVISIVLLSIGAAFLSIWELRGSNELLDKIALVQPGVNLNSIKNQLGQQMYVFDDTNLNLMQHRGSVKDPAFYQGKKLYWFSVSNCPPARALEVYTDKNDIVVYASWQDL